MSGWVHNVTMKGGLGRSLWIVVLLSVVSVLNAEEWIVGETDGHRVLSAASPYKTNLILEDLGLLKQAFERLYPQWLGQNAPPLQIIVCRDNVMLKSLAPDQFPSELAGFFGGNLHESFIIIDGDRKLNEITATFFHEYVHYLMGGSEDYHPLWVREGVAELFSTLRRGAKGSIEMGLVPMASVSVLQYAPLINWERFFSLGAGAHEYVGRQSTTGVFYSQAWGLMHMFLFGNTDLPKNGLNKLFEWSSKNVGVSEEQFEEFFGFGFGELNRRLRMYASTGDYVTRTLTIDSSREEGEITFRPAIEGEKELAFGSVKFASQGPNAAAGYLLNAYRKLPHSTEAAVLLGYLSYSNEQLKDAYRYLAEAIEKGAQSPLVFYYAVVSLYRSINPSPEQYRRALNGEERARAMEWLFRAREVGAEDLDFFVAVGEILVASEGLPNDTEFALLEEGISFYPEEPRLGYYQAYLLWKQGASERAQAVMDRYRNLELKPSGRKLFEKLEQMMQLRSGGLFGRGKTVP